MRVLVIGGTGFVGPHVAGRLSHAGCAVTLLHRGRTHADLPPAVHHLHCPDTVFGDRGYFSGLAAEFKRIAPDVVLDMIPVVEADARAVLDAFRGIARRVVALGSQDVYRAYGLLLGLESGPPVDVPMAEDAPLRNHLYPYRTDPPRAADDPSRWRDDYDKILVERAILGDPDLAGTILRLPMVYGPRDRQHRLFEYLKRMDDGRPAILLPRNLAAWRWTRGYVENVAAAVALAVVDERAAGRVYNVGEPDALSTAAWVRKVATAAGWEGRIVIADPDRVPSHLQSAMRFEHHLVADVTRMGAELGHTDPVPRDTALARTVTWERENPPERIDDRLFDYAAEDAALEDLE